MVDKARLEALLADVQRQRAQHEANRNACNGAIDVLTQLLKEWDAPPPEPEADADRP